MVADPRKPQKFNPAKVKAYTVRYIMYLRTYVQYIRKFNVSVTNHCCIHIYVALSRWKQEYGTNSTATQSHIINIQDASIYTYILMIHYSIYDMYWICAYCLCTPVPVVVLIKSYHTLSPQLTDTFYIVEGSSLQYMHTHTLTDHAPPGHTSFLLLVPHSWDAIMALNTALCAHRTSRCAWNLLPSSEIKTTSLELEWKQSTSKHYRQYNPLLHVQRMTVMGKRCPMNTDHYT